MNNILTFITNPLVEAIILAILVYVSYRNKKRIESWFRQSASANRFQYRDFAKELQEQATPAQAVIQAPPAASAQRSLVLAPVAPVAAPVVARSAIEADQTDWAKKPQQAPRIKLSAVAEADNLAIIGQKGSGKTTALLTIMAHRQSDYIVLDPHNAPGKWPTSRVIGGGRKYGEIKTALCNLDGGMNSRFQDLNDGKKAEGMFARRTLVADEFRSIAQNIPEGRGEKGAGKYILDRISEGRKVGECVLLAGHNDTVGDLGIEGSSSMKTCFDFIIYTAGIALQRYGEPTKGSASPTMLDELRDMERPMVAWKTETNEWFILDFDLEPVLVIAQPIIAVEPAEPVRAMEVESLAIPAVPVVREPVRELVRSGSTHLEAAQGGSGLIGAKGRYELVRELVRAGKSGNFVREHMKGTDGELLALVKQAKQELGLTDAA